MFNYLFYGNTFDTLFANISELQTVYFRTKGKREHILDCINILLVANKTFFTFSQPEPSRILCAVLQL